MNMLEELQFWFDQVVGQMQWECAENVEYTEITTEYEEDKRIVGRV